jgi:hypothetical protein
VVVVAFATRHREDLVRPDYYEEEVRYQEQLERLNRTLAVRHDTAITYDDTNQNVVITLPPEHARQQPSGRINFYRPSDASLDREVRLAPDAAGIQRVDASKLRAGLWKVRLYWTVHHQDFYLDQPIIVGPKTS